MSLLTPVIIYLAALAVGFVLLWLVLPHLWKKREIARLRQTCRENRAVVLTFDDGPSDHMTQALIGLLEDLNAKASFFILGRNIAGRQELVKDLADRGHDVGSHSYDHLHAWKAAPTVVAADIARGCDALEFVTPNARLFRPPFGKSNLWSVLAAARRGLRTAYWTLDTKDTRAPGTAPEILRELGRAGGGVVLMHDLEKRNIGGGQVAHSDYVLETTRQIVEFARKNDMRIMRFSDLPEKG